MKPMFSAPMRLETGTRTSSKNSSAVSEARSTSLSSLRETLTPGVSSGTMMSDLFLCGPPSCEVLHSRQIQSPCTPLVIHIFEPLIT
ncbi:Uncharacterised protein [Bordetella pertussis]|nr:Uncharacterised protein [Bordetella pertussis]CFW31506.1 Uncharacterised protein [Bordetella pertussis]CPL06117.1 Uncharacterised protein [Bordetella pertussis]